MSNDLIIINIFNILLNLQNYKFIDYNLKPCYYENGHQVNFVIFKLVKYNKRLQSHKNILFNFFLT